MVRDGLWRKTYPDPHGRDKHEEFERLYAIQGRSDGQKALETPSSFSPQLTRQARRTTIQEEHLRQHIRYLQYLKLDDTLFIG